jgi:hypothetical protein
VSKFKSTILDLLFEEDEDDEDKDGEEEEDNDDDEDEEEDEDEDDIFDILLLTSDPSDVPA